METPQGLSINRYGEWFGSSGREIGRRARSTLAPIRLPATPPDFQSRLTAEGQGPGLARLVLARQSLELPRLGLQRSGDMSQAQSDKVTPERQLRVRRGRHKRGEGKRTPRKPVAGSSRRAGNRGGGRTVLRFQLPRLPEAGVPAPSHKVRQVRREPQAPQNIVQALETSLFWASRATSCARVVSLTAWNVGATATRFEWPVECSK